MLRSFNYRLSPTRKQEATLQWTLDRSRELYNAALQERRDAYRMAQKSITYYDQAAQLPAIKQDREEYQTIHSQVLQETLRRVDKAMQAFFRRVKLGQTPGYPRFQGKNRYDSFTYPQGGFSLTHDNHVCLSKIGSIKVKLHRQVSGKIKTCTIKREGEHWYVVFACEMPDVEKLPVSYEEVGIDLGITHFAALSNGEMIENPRHYRKAEKKRASLQQALSHKKRGSQRRQKAVKQIAKAHKKVANQRKDFLHKQSKKLVDRYHMIAFEDLSTKNLVRRPKPKHDEATGQYLPNGAGAKGGLNKSITDAGWERFVQMCSYKAANAGRILVQVNPKDTSQLCSGCRKKGPHKDLSERTHICVHCGLVLDRDHNAALNILRAGRVLQGAIPVEAPGL